MNGKAKCKILKEIRQKIADSNDIPFVVAECKYQGDCKGTCPKCEAELQYLEKELKKRQTVGKVVLATGIATSIVLTAASCSAVKDKIVDMVDDMVQGFAIEENVNPDLDQAKG